MRTLGAFQQPFDPGVPVRLDPPVQRGSRAPELLAGLGRPHLGCAPDSSHPSTDVTQARLGADANRSATLRRHEQETWAFLVVMPPQPSMWVVPVLCSLDVSTVVRGVSYVPGNLI